MLYKYCANIVQILWKYNIILYQYSTNFVQNFSNNVHILCKYFANIVQIMRKYHINITQIFRAIQEHENKLLWYEYCPIAVLVPRGNRGWQRLVFTASFSSTTSSINSSPASDKWMGVLTPINSSSTYSSGIT